MFITQAHAQTAPAPTPSTANDIGSSLANMLPLVLMFGVMYLVLIRPQMKKAKEHRAMVEALAKGDEVVVAGGVLGKITELGDNYLGVAVAPNTEIQVQRASVVQVLPKGTVK